MPQTQMPGLPRDVVAQFEHARRTAGDDPLAGVRGRVEVKLDTEREIEATLAGASISVRSSIQAQSHRFQRKNASWPIVVTMIKPHDHQ